MILSHPASRDSSIDRAPRRSSRWRSPNHWVRPQSLARCPWKTLAIVWQLHQKCRSHHWYTGFQAGKFCQKKARYQHQSPAYSRRCQGSWGLADSRRHFTAPSHRHPLCNQRAERVTDFGYCRSGDSKLSGGFHHSQWGPHATGSSGMKRPGRRQGSWWISCDAKTEPSSWVPCGQCSESCCSWSSSGSPGWVDKPRR